VLGYMEEWYGWMTDFMRCTTPGYVNW
jgi:hypothetical protein